MFQLKIDEEREAYKLTLNRISEAEKARQLASLTNSRVNSEKISISVIYPEIALQDVSGVFRT